MNLEKLIDKVKIKPRQKWIAGTTPLVKYEFKKDKIPTKQYIIAGENWYR